MTENLSEAHAAVGVRPRRTKGALAAAAALFLVTLSGAQPADAAENVPISGAGSTWAQNQMDSWRARLHQYGYTVNYSGTGSADGRSQFRNATVDFAVSELRYGMAEGGAEDPAPTRPFTYVPILTGGIGFQYNLRVDGKRIENLKLSSATVAGIFTKAITRWNDPRILAENPGTALPDIPVVPVVRADTNGTTAGLTQWLASQEPSAWSAYCAAAGRGAGCGTTSLFPTMPGDVALAGSNGVTGFVGQAWSNGAITYAESSYRLLSDLPMAKVLNSAGYYQAPTSGAVMAGLAAAALDESGVVRTDAAYTDRDPRTYPVPLVGYLVVPTSTGSGFTSQKGHTLGGFTANALCDATSPEDLGYAAMPPHLVEAGLDRVTRIPGATPTGVDEAECVSKAAAELQSVPQPPECERVGAPSCDSPPTTPTTPTTPPVDPLGQTITTTLHSGALVISVAGDPNVELPGPKVDKKGEYLRTSGPMTPVVVTDTRPGNIGWSASGQVDDFTNEAGDIIDGSGLTWTPVVVDRGNVRSVTAGAPVLPGDGDGLKDARTLATGTGPGTTNVGAVLELRAPTSTRAGRYTTLLTVTVI